MKILFLSARNCCRSQIAEAILRHLGRHLDIYSAGVDPAPEINPVAIKVMQEAGITITPKKPAEFSEYSHIEFDYLITVGDGTQEELQLPKVKYKRKMHLGFSNPFKHCNDPGKILENCREIRDEIMVELDYFYNRILQPQLRKKD
jgi:arsenate reductase (thioredoxin)